jgi:hypothetical protein
LILDFIGPILPGLRVDDVRLNGSRRDRVPGRGVRAASLFALSGGV